MPSKFAQIFAALRHWVLHCMQDPQASPERAALYRTRQFRSALEHLVVAAASTLILLLGTVAYFWSNPQRPTLLVLCSLLLANTLFNIGAAMRMNRRPAEHRVSTRDVNRFALTLGTCAALWGVLAAHGLKVGEPAQQALVVGVSAAMVGTGAWMYAHLVPIAAVWVVGLCGAVALSLFADFPALVVMLPLYGGTLLVSILLTSRIFLRGLIAEQELAKQTQVVGLLLHDFEQNATDWLWETDVSGCLRHVSVRLAGALQLSPEQLHGQSLLALLQRLDPLPPDPAHGSHLQLAEKLQQRKPFRGLVVAVMLQGERRWWSITANPLLASNGRIEGWRGVGSDITVLRERDMALNRLANTDALTGLANRHRFNQALAANFPDGGDTRPCVLCMVDLDNFKSINDSHGHTAGDDLLKQVGRRLQGASPPNALLARLGGDEFALLVACGADSLHAAELGDQLQAALMQPCVVNGHHLRVHASIGVALAPGDARTAGQLVQAADTALYAAKAAGRRMTRLFEARMETESRNKRQLLADLDGALERGELSLHYQPQMDLQQGRLTGFEALVRWQHPVRGLIGPVEFIPLAEDSGLIVPIGQWVLHQACSEAASWPTDLQVAVNVSAVQCQRTDLRACIQAALRASNLAPSRLEIELTESALLQDSAAAIALLHALRQDGVRVALDDFGTGFSSLAYLRTFPLDRLKIDRSFVKSLDVEGEAHSAQAIVQAVQSLAQAIGLQTTAEGVETARQGDVLRRLGCHHAQGFLYGRPMDVALMRDCVERHRVHGTQRASAPAV